MHGKFVILVLPGILVRCFLSRSETYKDYVPLFASGLSGSWMVSKVI